MKDLKEFIALLPEDGDYVNPSSVNVGPIENRNDLLTLNNNIGDITYLVNERDQNFNSSGVDASLVKQPDNIVRKLNQLKSDIGNKEVLDFEREEDKYSIVNALNGFKRDSYKNVRLEDILARYTDQRRGDFIKTGIRVTYNTTNSMTNWYQQYLLDNIAYRTITTRGGFLRRSRTISVPYIKDQAYALGILNNAYEVKFDVSPGTAFINGYEIKFSENQTMSIPLTDQPYPQIINVYVAIKSIGDIVTERVWRNDITYNTNDFVIYSNSVYIAKTNIASGSSSPQLDTQKWKWIETFTEEDKTRKMMYLFFSYAKTTVLGNGKYDFDFPIPDASILIAQILKEPLKEPKVNIVETVRGYDMTKIRNIHTETVKLIENIGMLQSSIELDTAEIANLSRNMFTENFYTDNYRDIELEKTAGVSAHLSDGILSPHIDWTSYDTNINYLQLPISQDSINNDMSQINYTESSLINEFSVVGNSIFVFDIPEISFVVPGVLTEYKDEVKTGARTVQNVAIKKKYYRSVINAYGQDNVTSYATTSIGNMLSSVLITNQQNGLYKIDKDAVIDIQIPAHVFDSNEDVQISINNNNGAGKIASSNADGSLSTLLVLSASGYNRIAEIKIGVLGKITIYFPVKEYFYDKKYDIELTGLKSGAKAISSINIISKQKVNTYARVITRNSYITHYYPYDPLAQTFVATKDMYFSGISVIFDLISATTSLPFPKNSNFVLPENVTLFLCETTVGMPDHEKILGIANVVTGTSLNNMTWHKIDFDRKIKLVKNKVYAIFFATPDKPMQRNINGLTLNSNTRICLRTCTLAEPNKVTINTPLIKINLQQYIPGVMFKSSNIASWTPYQNSDLAFKIHEANFSKDEFITTEVINTTPDTYTDVSLSYNLLESLSDKSNTSFSVNMTYGDDSTEALPLQNNTVETFNTSKKLLNKCNIECKMITSDEKITDTVTSCSIHLGKVSNKSVYISKNIDLNYSELVITKNLKLSIMPAYTNFDITKIEVYYCNEPLISESAWKPFDNFTLSGEEYVFSKSNVEIFQDMRIKIVLNVLDNNTENRPSIKKLRLFYN